MQVGAGEARVDLDAERLGLLAEPAADLAEADDVVAGVVETGREQGGGQTSAAALR